MSLQELDTPNGKPETEQNKLKAEASFPHGECHLADESSKGMIHPKKVRTWQRACLVRTWQRACLSVGLRGWKAQTMTMHV